MVCRRCVFLFGLLLFAASCSCRLQRNAPRAIGRLHKLPSWRQRRRRQEEEKRRLSKVAQMSKKRLLPATRFVSAHISKFKHSKKIVLILAFVCSLPDESGTFAAGIVDLPRFAWSSATRSCSRFSYYGAQGNRLAIINANYLNKKI